MNDRRRRGSTRSIRIIGGQWRGRKVSVPDLEGLRPTPDRVRETLFNWLNFAVADSRCLDMFAGTGAVGLEALSRGALHCTFIERQSTAANNLQKSVADLGADSMATIERGDALNHRGGPYDIIFVDPPFADDLTRKACLRIHDQKLLATDGILYVETAKMQSAEFLQNAKALGLEAERVKRAGEVCSHLLRPTAA